MPSDAGSGERMRSLELSFVAKGEKTDLPPSMRTLPSATIRNAIG